MARSSAAAESVASGGSGGGADVGAAPGGGARFADPTRTDKAELPELEYSRWKAGPESFGPVGRITMTIGLVIALVIGYFLFQGNLIANIGIVLPGAVSYIVYGIVAVILGGWALKTIWKRARVR